MRHSSSLPTGYYNRIPIILLKKHFSVSLNLIINNAEIIQTSLLYKWIHLTLLCFLKSYYHDWYIGGFMLHNAWKLLSFSFVTELFIFLNVCFDLGWQMLFQYAFGFRCNIWYRLIKFLRSVNICSGLSVMPPNRSWSLGLKLLAKNEKSYVQTVDDYSLTSIFFIIFLRSYWYAQYN